MKRRIVVTLALPACGGCGALFGVDFGDAHPYADGAVSFDAPSSFGDGAAPGDGQTIDPLADGATGALAVGQSSPRALAIDDATVYWANLGPASGAGSIMAVSKSGGTPMTLASGQANPTDLAVYAGYVYWTNQGDGTVMRAEKATANSGQTIAFGQKTPVGIAADDTGVYWTNQGIAADGTLQRAPLDGGAAAAVASQLIGPGHFAIDATHAYIALSSGGLVFTALAGGDTLHDVANDGTGGVPSHVAVNGANLFWTDLGTNTVYQSATDGGGARGIAGGAEPEWIASDGVNVYFTARGGNTVEKVPVGGGASSAIASNQGYAWGVAVDDAFVYWTASADGTVNKAPK